MAVLRRICAVNFWPGFSLETGLVKYLFDRALESFFVAASEKEADIVLTSVFPKHARLYRYIPVPQKWPLFPEKTIVIVWENQRPNYRKYRFSLSSDFDSYGGRNCRVPGCLPLYYSDGWFKFDFNQKAFVNRIAFRSIDEFVVHVASLHASRVAMNEIFARPLLTKRPTLDDAIAFLARSCAEIMNRPSRQRSIWPVRQFFS
jgi:hypothetical protein